MLVIYSGGGRTGSPKGSQSSAQESLYNLLACVLVGIAAIQAWTDYNVVHLFYLVFYVFRHEVHSEPLFYGIKK